MPAACSFRASGSGLFGPFFVERLNALPTLPYLSSPAYEFDDVLNIKTSFNKRAAAVYNNYSLGMETGMSKPANARKCLLIHLPKFQYSIVHLLEKCSFA